MRFAVGQRYGLRRRGATGKGRLPGGSVCKTVCFHHNPKSLVAADRARPGSGNDIRDVLTALLLAGAVANAPEVRSRLPTLKATASFLAHLLKGNIIFSI